MFNNLFLTYLLSILCYINILSCSGAISGDVLLNNYSKFNKFFKGGLQNHPFMEIRPLELSSPPKIFLYIRKLSPVATTTTTYSSVYKATLFQDGKNTFIIKFPRKDLEKEILTQLSISMFSPFVPPILNAIPSSTFKNFEGIPFMIMKYIPNTSHSKQFAMNDEDFCFYSHQLIEAIESYQHCGFVHCNLNPWNVIIDWVNRKVWIVDWAKGTPDGEIIPLRQTSPSQPSPPPLSDYAPPEMIFIPTFNPIYNSDIWSAAIILLTWLFKSPEITNEKVVLENGLLFPMIFLHIYGSKPFENYFKDKFAPQGWSKIIKYYAINRDKKIFETYIPIIDAMLNPNPFERPNSVQLLKTFPPAPLIEWKHYYVDKDDNIIVPMVGREDIALSSKVVVPFEVSRVIDEIKINNDEFSLISYILYLLPSWLF